MNHWASIRTEMLRLGSAVSDKRKREGMSQAELVDHVAGDTGPVPGWNVPALSRLEAGTYVPGTHIGVELSRWLGPLQAPVPVVTPTPARSSDPDTSHTARPRADTVVHEAVLTILDSFPDGLPHFQIVEHYDREHELNPERYPVATEQRIRTATRELVDAHRVLRTDRTVTNTRGRECRVWQLRGANQ